MARAELDRIDRLNPQLNAFVTVTPELALEGAAAAERAYAAGTAGPLAGIPATIKDLVQLAGRALHDGQSMPTRRCTWNDVFAPSTATSSLASSSGSTPAIRIRNESWRSRRSPALSAR